MSAYTVAVLEIEAANNELSLLEAQAANHGIEVSVMRPRLHLSLALRMIKALANIDPCPNCGRECEPNDFMDVGEPGNTILVCEPCALEMLAPKQPPKQAQAIPFVVDAEVPL